MTNIVLCPNCHGDKQVSQPHILTQYQCPTCDGRGWIDTDEEFDVLKGIALSAMETSENLMDECVSRGDKIKALDALVGEKDLRIADLDAQRDIVRKTRDKREDELLAYIDRLLAYIDELNDNIVEFRKSRIIDMKTRDDISRQAISKREDELIMTIEERDEQITRLKSKNRDAAKNLVLLDDILKIVNPIIKSGEFVSTDSNLKIKTKMFEVCQIVNQFRRKHNMVG